jgi:hypothetical protein
MVPISWPVRSPLANMLATMPMSPNSLGTPYEKSPKPVKPDGRSFSTSNAAFRDGSTLVKPGWPPAALRSWKGLMVLNSAPAPLSPSPPVAVSTVVGSEAPVESVLS